MANCVHNIQNKSNYVKVAYTALYLTLKKYENDPDFIKGTKEIGLDYWCDFWYKYSNTDIINLLILFAGICICEEEKLQEVTFRLPRNGIMTMFLSSMRHFIDIG
jgi:hypothetical protein